jgi:hypothetical protein
MLIHTVVLIQVTYNRLSYYIWFPVWVGVLHVIWGSHGHKYKDYSFIVHSTAGVHSDMHVLIFQGSLLQSRRSLNTKLSTPKKRKYILHYFRKNFFMKE